MTIAESLTKLSTDIEAAYTAIDNKGGTVPEEKNTDNLATAIGTITGGGVRPPLPEYPYPIDEEEMADGGEWGKVAYLRDDTVHYYTATSADDLVLVSAQNGAALGTVKTLDDGFVITGSILLAYSFGTSTTIPSGYMLNNCPLLQAVYIPETVSFTTWPTSFCQYCPNLNCPIDIPEGITVLKGLLGGCTSFNQPVTLPSTLKTISNSFLGGCVSFNQPIQIPEGVTTMNGTFLTGCTSFDQPISLPDSVTTIASEFLSGCSNFNSPVVLPDTLQTITTPQASNRSFLSGCTSFNQPIQIPASLRIIPGYFLNGCSSFNSSIEFRGELQNIANYFLYNCTSFNQPLDIPSSVTTMGSFFLGGCTSFNQPLDWLGEVQLDTGWSESGSGFLYGCTSFNQPITFPPNVYTVPISFLRVCTSFNQPITFHEGMTGVREYFLGSCTSFDSTLTFPSGFKSINPYFLNGCSSYKQPLTIPATVTTVSSSYFMYNCKNFTGPLAIETSAPFVTNSYMLSTNAANSLIYTTGVTLTGPYAQAWKDALPDRTTSPYRKLILAEEPEAEAS